MVAYIFLICYSTYLKNIKLYLNKKLIYVKAIWGNISELELALNLKLGGLGLDLMSNK